MNESYGFNLEFKSKIGSLLSAIKNENEEMEKLLNQFIITEDEEDFIKQYANHFHSLYTIYIENQGLLDAMLSPEELKVITDGKNLIERSALAINADSALGMLKNAYDELSVKQENEDSLSKTGNIALTRSKNNYNIENEFKNNETHLNNLKKDEKLGVRGFTNIILIIATAITFGMYIATLLYK